MCLLINMCEQKKIASWTFLGVCEFNVHIKEKKRKIVGQGSKWKQLHMSVYEVDARQVK